MSLFLLSVGITSFIIYFYSIGLRYLGFIPIIFLAILISYNGLTNSIQTKSSELLEKYSLYITWTIVMIGFLGIMNFFDIGLIKICLTLISINIILWIGSYIAKYQDGKSVFQIGYYLSITLLLIVTRHNDGFKNFIKIAGSFWILDLCIHSFIIFILRLFINTSSNLNYKLFILSLGTILITIIKWIPNTYLAIATDIIILFAIFSIIFKIEQFKPIQQSKKSNTSIRRILAGERITQPAKIFDSKFMETLHHFIHNMPNITKQILEILNISLIFSAILCYFYSFGSFSNINQLLYRLIIAFFIGNVMVLKKTGYNSLIQNLAVFLVINFAIYLSLFSYFDGNFGSIATRGIIRNISSSIIIFSAPHYLSKFFQKNDYIYRTISIILAMIINIFIIAKTGLAGELIFFIILLYIGLQSMLLYYSLKYANKTSKITTIKESI